MITILTPQQMKAADEFAIFSLRIPSLQLMENAGKSVVEEIKKKIGTLHKKTIVIFCGKGNNGGDGFVIARLAVTEGAEVTVVLMEKENALQGDAFENFQRLLNYGIEKLDFKQFPTSKKKNYDIIVDAIFGTSFHGTIKGKYASAIQCINTNKKNLVVSVDIPSGLNAETGEASIPSVKANVTVTFGAPKIGFYIQRAKEYCGDIVISDIGLPKKAIDKNSNGIFLVEKKDVQVSIPKRPFNSHKHTVGKIFILAGSKGMTGAALLCSQSAMRTGTGSVILGIPGSQFSIVAKRTLEVMPFGLNSISEGSLAYSSLPEIKKKIDWADVVLLGPGLSQNEETQKLIREIIQFTSKPMVIDADALNALSNHLEILQKRKSKEIIITPHLGEFSRLVKISSKEIELRKILLGKEFAQKYRLTLVLKGAPTFTFTKNGKIFVNSTGNPGMSTAGSGDVLAGIISSLLSQGNSGEQSAINGVYIHGAAGDHSAKKMGIQGMIASDLIEEIPIIMKELTEI
jgi:ADP-dependent NAD(P)H-hydrate dehydratase / NAD(P)H-hydrate epimerase